MKKVITILCIVFNYTLAFCQEATDSVKYYYSNGVLSSVGILENGKPNGYWKTYYDTGVLKTTGNRVNFKLEGVWQFYDSEGYLTIEIAYKDGLKHGLQKSYTRDSVVIKEIPFILNKREGICKNFYKNGKQQEFIPYVADNKEGVGYLFDTSEVIVQIINYTNNKIIKRTVINERDRLNRKQGKWMTFYSDYTLKSECTYLNDMKHGFERIYKKNGDLISLLKYDKGDLVKEVEELSKIREKTLYNSDGLGFSTGGYDENNVPHGVHRKMDSLGRVVSSKIYSNGKVVGEGIVEKNGLKNGFWKEYYQTGELKSEGKYKNNTKIGEWKYYHKNGQLEQTGFYINGKPDGEWNWFYKSGNLLRKEIYIEGLEEGISVEYSDSGAIITKGNYEEGMKQGQWIYEMGDHKEIGAYKDDLLDGEWLYYYNNKIIMFKGSYFNDIPIGRHTYWYENGVLKEFGDYKNGKKTGDWFYYNSHGGVNIIINFSDGLERSYNGYEFSPEHNPEDYVD